jgi:hypothetical protein
MKPNFALNVTDDSLGLLHRTRAGWTTVGETRFDRDDLDQALGFLRTTATELAPKGVTTKIVIPNSQILYMELQAPGPSDTARRAQITKALEGRTPYAVTELVFDWSGKGDVVQVAVLARETLEQAEAFLAPHGFNAISFVAIPPEGAFPGEPWFGPTSAAASILGKGKSVTRDTEAIVLPVTMAAEVEPAAAEPEVVAEPEPEPMVAAELAPEPQAVNEPEPVVAEPEVVVAEAEAVAAEAVAEPAPEPFQEAADFAEAPVVAEHAPEVAVVEEAAEEAPFTHVADTGFVDSGVVDTGIAEVPPPAPTEEDDLPPAPSQAALIAFASRRTATEARAATDAPRPAGGTAMPGLVAERLAARAQALAEAGNAKVAGRIEPGGREGARLSFVTAPTIAGPGLPGAKKRKGPVPAPVAAAAAAVTDMPARKPLTKPGGTFGPAPARGKPRYLGLILTGILLLFLALVAAWSSFFLASNSTDTPQTDVATADTTLDVPAVDDEMLADAQDPADFAEPAPDALTAAEPLAEPASEPVPEAVATTEPAVEPAPDAVAAAEPVAEPVVEEPTPEPEAVASPAPETGVDATLPMAAAPDAAQDEIFLSSLDASPPVGEAAALAQPTALADAPPTAQMPPPPFGTVYQFDAAGLIIPTPEGIITPEGVRLVAGPPALIPPARPAAIAAAAAEAAAAAVAPVEPAVPATTDPAATFAADPALANARPRVRPEGLVPAGTIPRADDAALTSDTPVRFTSLIPRARPETVVAAALAAGEEARLATEAASLAASAAASEASEAAVLALVAPDANAGRVAVSVSRVPAPRPRDLEKAVAAAIAAASRGAPDPEPEPQQQTAVEPEAEEEPEVAEAAPSRPTGRTVAEQATFVNAIALNRINLIGVYGTQSNRYALIRQANGRYKKVSVGDRIDGGRVAAITDDEVRYEKGGRLIALEMPRG